MYDSYGFIPIWTVMCHLFPEIFVVVSNNNNNNSRTTINAKGYLLPFQIN